MGLNWTKPPAGTGIDWSSPLSPGLVACWPFNEASGPPMEIISGTPFAMSGTTTWAASPNGSALGTDASTGYGTAHITAMDRPTAFTVGLLWKCPAGSTTSGRIFEKGGNSEWTVSVNEGSTTNKAYFTLWPASGSHITSTDAAVCDGAWRMIHVRWFASDGATFNGHMFVNGVQQATQTFTTGTDTSLTAAANLNLFRYGGGGFISGSTLGGIWYWNRALTAAAVASHAAAPWQVFQSPAPWYLTAYVPAAADPVFPSSTFMSMP